MRNPYHAGPPSQNFDGLRFFNPGEPETDRTLRQILAWKLAESAAPWPGRVEVRQAVPERFIEGLRVTVVGHATVLIQVAGLNILTDPIWSRRASPVKFAGPARVTRPGVSFDRLPKIDVILVSHNHYDHLDLDTLRRLHDRDAPLIVTPLGNDAIIRRHVPKARVMTGNWGDAFKLGLGAEAIIVPANHWSSRNLRDRRMALWGGFMIKTLDKLIYFAGDTGYGSGDIFRAMRIRYGAPDLALIPIGAYAPRWFMSSQHCDPREAVQIMLDLDAEHAIGIHWGTFKLTDEAREEPPALLKCALSDFDLPADRFVAGWPGDVWNLSADHYCEA